MKDHCNGKAHMKAIWSFITSVLKMSAKIVQIKVNFIVLLDEFIQVRRKASIKLHILLLKVIYCSGNPQI